MAMVTLKEYEDKKSTVSRQLLLTEEARLGKTTSNLFRHRKNHKHRPVDVHNFNNIISIDPIALTADVEGMITYEDLVAETLKSGLMPTVVPELKTITVGGAATGIGIEATSFKFGFVHETIREFDVLLSSGKTVTCSRTQNQDLFYGFPNSYGTLGYALRLRIRLIPTLPYVEISHRRFSDFNTYFEALEQTCKSGSDFVDGTIFSTGEMYITSARFVAAAPYLSDYSYMNIYYKSIRERFLDYMTTGDFIWRWDTDWYWGSKKFGAEYPLVRRLLGRNRLRSSFYWKLRSELNRTPFWRMLSPIAKYETVIQDVEIPIESAAEFMDFQSRQIGITPVWACPVNPYDKTARYPLFPLRPCMHVNLGFWDIVRTDREPGYYNRLVEKKVTELGGRKMLYSDSFYTPEEFHRLYGGETYDLLKKKYDPNNTLHTLYQECVSS
jgi:FAD/FMN-containing dehydrogenase